MAKSHGAKAQKRAAKQKAKRQAKRAIMIRRSSSDPTIRLQNVARWSVVRCLAGSSIADQGIGHALIVRSDPSGGLVFALFLVDVYCLGVKDAFWRTGTSTEIDDMVKQMEQVESMSAMEPACFAKLILGAVEFAEFYGFTPHPDFRHASKLLDGIDAAACSVKFKYGKDGRPFYFRGPNETEAEALVIANAVRNAGGHYLMMVPDAINDEHEPDEETEFHGELDELEAADEPRMLEGPQ